MPRGRKGRCKCETCRLVRGEQTFSFDKYKGQGHSTSGRCEWCLMDGSLKIGYVLKNGAKTHSINNNVSYIDPVVKDFLGIKTMCFVHRNQLVNMMDELRACWASASREIIKLAVIKVVQDNLNSEARRDIYAKYSKTYYSNYPNGRPNARRNKSL